MSPLFIVLSKHSFGFSVRFARTTWLQTHFNLSAITWNLRRLDGYKLFFQLQKKKKTLWTVERRIFTNGSRKVTVPRQIKRNGNKITEQEGKYIVISLIHLNNVSTFIKTWLNETINHHNASSLSCPQGLHSTLLTYLYWSSSAMTMKMLLNDIVI